MELFVHAPQLEIVQGSTWNAVPDQTVQFECRSLGGTSNSTIVWLSASDLTFQELVHISFLTDLSAYQVNSTLIFNATSVHDRVNFTCLLSYDGEGMTQRTSIQLNVAPVSSDSGLVIFMAVVMVAATVVSTVVTYLVYFRVTDVDTTTRPLGDKKEPIILNNEGSHTIRVCQPQNASDVDYMEKDSHIWENFAV